MIKGSDIHLHIKSMNVAIKILNTMYQSQFTWPFKKTANLSKNYLFTKP